MSEMVNIGLGAQKGESEMRSKKWPTVINGRWCMAWAKDDMIGSRNMNILERIWYFPRMIKWALTDSSYKKESAK
jgi:hypothetical protein